MQNDAKATTSDRGDAEDARGWDDGDVPRAEDGGRAYEGRLLGVRMSETAALVTASTACIGFIGASCYFEEYVYRSLPNFDYFWTVALAELVTFASISAASSLTDGTLTRARKAPIKLYVIQALLLAAYSAVGKLCYKWINYATGTVLRSSKLVFTMVISVAWLKRKYKPHQVAAALLLVIAVAFFGVAEHEQHSTPIDADSSDIVSPNAEIVTDESSLGLSEDVRLALGFGLSVFAIFLGSLQSNVSEHAMRNHGADVRENILYTNAIGSIAAFVGVAYFEGSDSIRYLRETPGAAGLLLARSVTFYFGAYFFSLLTRNFGATLATAVTTIRKVLTVIASFILFPSDKPFDGYYVYGVALFIAAVICESIHHVRAAASACILRPSPSNDGSGFV